MTDQELRSSPVVLEIPSASGSVPLRPGSSQAIENAANDIFKFAIQLMTSSDS